MKIAYFGEQRHPMENRMVGDFVSKNIWGEPDRLEKYCTMGVFENGNIVAGTAYHNWHPNDGVIELSSASICPRWLSKPVIRAMFHLPFSVVGARLTVLRVSERNKRMRRIAIRFGFHETIIPRIRGENEAECVYTLSADDWSKHRMNENG